ncbi:hypothetical protein OG911_25295 [Streptomyces sp. NBC_00208]|uniref:hypothetical protein n=1 Tax=Streptomyces sp. NBC_00208 TaxID=2975681 RepID=UPI002E291AE0|nr:hypothetical protein [Streptomyces sp. NBC_00208]
MPDLATIADLEARGITVASSEESVTNTYLAVASAAIRDAAGSNISQTTVTVILDGNCEQRLRLPGAPVTAIHAVTLDEVPVLDAKLSNGALVRSAGWAGDDVSVTYTYGLPAIPADIVDLTCRLAANALAAYRSGDPAARQVVSERIGDYAVTYADTETGTLSLADHQRSRLAARFGTSIAVVRSI